MSTFNSLESKLKLYPIIDTSITPTNDGVFALATAILKGGAKVIQLRAKDVSDSEFLKLATGLREITTSFKSLLIINDRVDVAILSNADGVHLGTDDLSIEKARELFAIKSNGHKIIGISTHNLPEIKDAIKRGADYIGFGPVFKTTTKKDIKETTVKELLSEAVKLSTIPLTAIAGIKEHHIEELTSMGVKSIALISDIARSPNPEEKVKDLITKLTKKIKK